MVKAFVKWLLLVQGVIWSFLTICILLFGLRFGMHEIVFAWMIAILFALLIWKIDSAQ
jgi:hypothetical protein